MAQHVEINPDDSAIPFSLGLKALRSASTQKTHKTGTVRIPTSTGKDFIAGEGAEDGANWIDEDGNQTPLVDTDAIDKAVDEISQKADAASANADKAYEEAKKTGQLAVTASKTEYATSTDATATPSDGWSETPPEYVDGQYTWLRITVTYGDGRTELSNPVLMTGPKGAKGEKGDTGDTGTAGAAGVSVTSLTTFWQLATDTPAPPTGAGNPSGWSITEPTIPDGYDGKLYRTIRTIMSDGTATWTTPGVDSMFAYMARTYKTASGAVTVSNEAKQTAEGNAETIKQVSATANDALSKATTVETNFDGFKTEVSQTYQTKADMSTYSTKSYVDETSKSVALGVVQDYKGADGSGLATKSEVSATKDSIALAVQGTYTGDDDSLKSLQSSLDITRDKVTIAFSNAEAAAGVGTQLSEYQTANDTNVTDLTERLNAEIAARQSYITFGQDSDNPVMEMGAASSTAKMRLTNTQMQFLIGSVIAAYISNDRLNINNADILQTLRIGKYAFVPRSDGHMSLKYVG
ncbi:hypothetical protein [Bifidobacterium moukalabense]|uniref:Putative antifreeze protein n=1 Tax=Bifidobacterium moukalabense DSM 27321 TaxID=1435051 RepID=W4NB29_9BIFI|nr:hypothetical protein [Bifidobacterium moukalabense]ETY71686.1 putative antifreeze protein [Bifidobacterium moukalabense DSM 27321]